MVLPKSIPSKHFHRSEQQDHVLIQMYLNGQRITFKEQTFYKREQSFTRAMNELIRQRILKKGKEGFHDEYMLTQEGMIYASKVVLA